MTMHAPHRSPGTGLLLVEDQRPHGLGTPPYLSVMCKSGGGPKGPQPPAPPPDPRPSLARHWPAMCPPLYVQNPCTAVALLLYAQATPLRTAPNPTPLAPYPRYPRHSLATHP